MIEDGTGGLLLPPGDVSALADGVAGLLADEAERRAMGVRAAAHAAKYDWERSGDTMLCEYDRHAARVAARDPDGPDRDLDGRPPPAEPLGSTAAVRAPAASSEPKACLPPAAEQRWP